MNNNKQNSRRRSRGSHRKNLRSQSFDSNGPDVRIRGTAAQIHEKYCGLAKDAIGSGDSIIAENYLQHAEHYLRIMNAQMEQMEERQERQDHNNNRTVRNNADENARDILEDKEENGIMPQKQAENQTAHA